MKINKDVVAFAGVLGVFWVITLIVLFMGFGIGISNDFVSMGKIVTGVALQIFNVGTGQDTKAEETTIEQLPEK